MARNYKCPKCTGEFNEWENDRCPFCGLEKGSYGSTDLAIQPTRPGQRDFVAGNANFASRMPEPPEPDRDGDLGGI